MSDFSFAVDFDAALSPVSLSAVVDRLPEVFVSLFEVSCAFFIWVVDGKQRKIGMHVNSEPTSTVPEDESRCRRSLSSMRT